MKRKDMNLYKSEIRRLLRQIDSAFYPNHVYDTTSSICSDAAALRYVVDALYKDLIRLIR